MSFRYQSVSDTMTLSPLMLDYLSAFCTLGFCTHCLRWRVFSQQVVYRSASFAKYCCLTRYECLVWPKCRISRHGVKIVKVMKSPILQRSTHSIKQDSSTKARLLPAGGGGGAGLSVEGFGNEKSFYQGGSAWGVGVVHLGPMWPGSVWLLMPSSPSYWQEIGWIFFVQSLTTIALPGNVFFFLCGLCHCDSLLTIRLC